MAAQTKFKPTMFLAFDYDREEEYLNTMSGKGWQLKKGGMFFHLYEKCIESYRYKLDYNTKVKMNSDDYSRYLSFFSEQGWEHVNSTTNGWHYFRKKYSPDIADDEYNIYTDDTSLKEMLIRWIKLAHLMQIYFAFYLIISLSDFIDDRDITSGIAAILGLLSIALMQIGVKIMKEKKVNSKVKSSLGIHGSYIIVNGILILLILMIYLLFKY